MDSPVTTVLETKHTTPPPSHWFIRLSKSEILYINAPVLETSQKPARFYFFMFRKISRLNLFTIGHVSLTEKQAQWKDRALLQNSNQNITAIRVAEDQS